ncbi:hypothetical protein NEMIN01_0571 [Nematocida minor]|uniref:uncharacterized protein n=1 Tax=Nematocida minor TaxID=1912983 RepID=UPI00222037C2|nr:uncharacterized protein NEMIN01_0571 [Nematocida minor]KAI5189618.1 hypothetical protein NEMIN01_0571 [Nematocida minor]
MPKETHSDSDEYSGENSYSDDGSYSSNSNALSDLSSSSTMPALFSVQTDACSGDYDRIELLIRQAKTLNVLDITENDKMALFSKIVVRSEAESIDAEPWITSFFSLMEYAQVRRMLHPKVCGAIEKVAGHKEMNLLISARFSNVPEEVVFEMYEALPEISAKAGGRQLMLLSLEKPVGKEEEKEIHAVFPTFKFASSAKLFPVNTEDIFLILGKKKPVFVCPMSNNAVIKGYVLDKADLNEFIAAMREYYV